MRYSVYDYTRRAYDYYDAPGPGGTHAASPPSPATPAKKLGTCPDAASWKLPMGARKVGSGEVPQGRVASLGGADMFSDPSKLAAYAVLAYVAWKVVR